MAYQQIKDVIAHIRNCHRMLRDWLEQSRTRTDNAAVARLIEALRQDEHYLQLALTRIGAKDNPSVLETWLQYPPDELLATALQQVRFDKNIPIDEVVVQKQKFDRVMLQAYRQLQLASSAPRFQEFFQHLIDYTETRIKNQSWAVRDPELTGDNRI